MNGIIEYLQQSGPVKRQDLARHFGISERKLRAEIAELNMAGYPVISTGAGFVYSENPEEIKHAAAILKAGAISQIRRAAAILKIQPVEVLGQLDLFQEGA